MSAQPPANPIDWAKGRKLADRLEALELRSSFITVDETITWLRAVIGRAEASVDVMPVWCAECGTDAAESYVVTFLDGDQTDREGRTEVCLACHTRLTKEPGAVDPESRVGSTSVGHGPTPYRTLGHIAAEVRRMRADGITKHSIEYVLRHVFAEPTKE